MTDKHAKHDPATEAYIAALHRELRGYQVHRRDDRAAAVAAELHRLGAAPPRRTTTRKRTP